MSLDELKDKMSLMMFGLTKKDAMAAGICISCREPAMPNCYSDAGRLDYTIHGMCEKCYDNLFSYEEE